MEKEGRHRHLYRCWRALGYLDKAGLTCIKLSWSSSDGSVALKFLESAKTHFQEALSYLQRSKNKQQSATSGTLNEKTIFMTSTELAQYIARITLQIIVYKVIT